MPRMRAPMSTLGPWLGGACRGTGAAQRPGRSLEQIEQLFGNEARPRGIDVAVALRVLAVDEEALRHDQMQVVLCARHRDVEQAAFLLDLGRGAGAEVGRHAAIDDVEHDRPTSTPGPWRSGSSRGSDSPRRAAARRPGRWSRRADRASVRSGSVRAKDSRRRSARAGAGRRAASRRLRGCGRDAVRTRAARARDRPAIPNIGDCRKVSTKPVQSSPARGGDGMPASAAIGSAASAMRSSTRCAVAEPMPGSRCSRRKPATRSRGFSTNRSNASMSLMWAASRNFSPPNLTNGMLRRVSSISSGPLWLDVRNSTACSFRSVPDFAVLQHAFDDEARLVGLVADGDQLRLRCRTCARSRGSW